MKTPKRSFALMMLNGSLDDAAVVPYLDGLVREGYQGVCLHPRDGLLVPYLSRTYWDRIERIIELARERDLAIWFYDEFPYPSGAAGGLIPELYPTARVRALRFAPVDPVPGPAGMVDLGAGPLLALLRYTPGPDGAMLNVRDVTSDTGPHSDTWIWGDWHNLYYTGALHVRREDHERATAERFTWMYAPYEPLGDDQLLAVRLYTPAGKKGWAGMPDITMPEVTDLFLDTVYAPYARLAERLEMGDMPIFQDEVSTYADLPWNREIEARLRPIWGDDTFVKFAALYSPTVESWEQTRYEYRSAVGDALEKNWFERVANYCHANGLLMTGHLPGEESILMHAQFLGNAFKTLRHFDIPGYDIISSPTADDVNRCQATGAKLVQSAAWWADRREIMAEVFGAHGFHHDLQLARTEIAWLAAHDITLLTDHAAWMCSQSVRKYDAPPVWNRFNPLAVGHADLWEWHNWFCDLLAQYPFTPSTLVLFPVESFTRFKASEQALWQEEVSLLETFYHYACAHSLDCLYIPSEMLADVAAGPDGFTVQGQTFQQLIVPPVSAFQEDTWEALAALKTAAGFVWTHSGAQPEVTIFGPGGVRQELIGTSTTVACNEADLLEQKADWFSANAGARAAAALPFHSDVSIVQSRRRAADGSELLIVINPQTFAVELTCEPYFGTPVKQPPSGSFSQLYPGEDKWHLTLAARDVAVFELKSDVTNAVIKSDLCDLEPCEAHNLRTRVVGANHFSLKHGTTAIEGEEPVPFAPQPVSSTWKLGLASVDDAEERDCPYAPPFSMEKLAKPRKLTVSFPVVLDEAVADLTVVLDAESMPPGTIVTWNEVVLEAGQRDVYDQNNTVFVIPVAGLQAGAHVLRFEGTVTNGAQGILERPILTGSFLVTDESPLRLGAMSRDWIEAENFGLWKDAGMPESYGPVEYALSFTLSARETTMDRQLHLPSHIGVTEVFVNETSIGRSSWEPRVLSVPAVLLAEGENEVTLTLHGSWNDLFSRLNPTANGMSGVPQLIETPLSTNGWD